MPQLVHLAPVSLERRILRSGLRGRPCQLQTVDARIDLDEAVFAFPVLESFIDTHQWLRELRRRGRERLMGVYFKLPSDARVYSGRFGQPHTEGPLTSAIDWVRAHPAGAEIVIPRAVAVAAVSRLGQLRQDVGWVGTPEAWGHGDCVCAGCLPSHIPEFMRRVRAAYRLGLEKARDATTPEAAVEALRRLDVPLERAGHRLDPAKLFRWGRHASPDAREATAHLLTNFADSKSLSALWILAEDQHREVRETAWTSLIHRLGAQRAAEIFRDRLEPSDLASVVSELGYSHGGEDAVASLLDVRDSRVQTAVRAMLQELTRK